MKKLPILTAVLIALSGAAYAGGGHTHENGDHGYNPQYGGVAEKSNDIDYELVAKPEIITLYASSHGQPVNIQGASAKLILLNGTEKSNATLNPIGNEKLEANGNFKITQGTKIVALIAIPGKKISNIRFLIK